MFGLLVLGSDCPDREVGGCYWPNAIRASWVRNYKLDKLIRPAIEAVQEHRPFAEECAAYNPVASG